MAAKTQITLRLDPAIIPAVRGVLPMAPGGLTKRGALVTFVEKALWKAVNEENRRRAKRKGTAAGAGARRQVAG